MWKLLHINTANGGLLFLWGFAGILGGCFGHNWKYWLVGGTMTIILWSACILYEISSRKYEKELKNKKEGEN